VPKLQEIPWSKTGFWGTHHIGVGGSDSTPDVVSKPAQFCGSGCQAMLGYRLSGVEGIPAVAWLLRMRSPVNKQHNGKLNISNRRRKQVARIGYRHNGLKPFEVNNSTL